MQPATDERSSPPRKRGLGWVLAPVLIFGALIAWLVTDGRQLERRLTDLAARGVKRRSA
jgi:hypothetical protein